MVVCALFAFFFVPRLCRTRYARGVKWFRDFGVSISRKMEIGYNERAYSRARNAHLSCLTSPRITLETGTVASWTM